MIGLLLIMLGVGRIKGEAKHILRFVREKSNFYHKYDPPLTISGILERLQWLNILLVIIIAIGILAGNTAVIFL